MKKLHEAKMNMTYDEYKKLRSFFKNNILKGVKKENVCPFQVFDTLVKEWMIDKSEYKNIDTYLKFVEANGV